jgi:hypothetical protein
MKLLFFLITMGLTGGLFAEIETEPNAVTRGAALAKEVADSVGKNKLLDLPEKLIKGVEVQVATGIATPELMTGYFFEAWYQLASRRQTAKSSMESTTALTYANSIKIFGSKFRQLQKITSLSDQDLLRLTGKKPNVPKILAEDWPPPSDVAVGVLPR